MKVIYEKDSQYILRILRGEELVEQVLNFCAEKNIDAAWVQGLGAADHIVLSYYDFKKQEYIKKEICEDCELLNLTGNIAFADGTRMMHAHVTLSKKDYTTTGGHLHSMIVSGTGEIMISKLEGYFEREEDIETGLKLLE